MLAHSGGNAGNRKQYDQPVLRKLRLEQAALFLVGHAYVGHHGASEILELLFPPFRSYREAGIDGSARTAASKPQCDRNHDKQ
jgi:hypothetical protein